MSNPVEIIVDEIYKFHNQHGQAPDVIAVGGFVHCDLMNEVGDSPFLHYDGRFEPNLKIMNIPVCFDHMLSDRDVILTIVEDQK